MSNGNQAMTELLNKHCRELPAGTAALSADEIHRLIGALPSWKIIDGQLTKTFAFKNYYETMAFVNAIAWISHRENHHPDLEVGYNKCVAKYSTHSVGGLSENDFICAAKIEEFSA